MHRSRNQRWAVALFGVLLALRAVPVLAQTSKPIVTIHVEPCVPVERAQLERLLAVELTTSTGPATESSAPTHVWVGCVEGGIELQLQDGVTRKTMARVLPASSFTDASSTRLLALAVAEFVVASWVELQVQPEPVVEPVGPPPTPAALQTARRVAHTASARANDEVPQSSVSAGLSAQLWSAHDGVLLGVQLRLLQRLTPAVALSIAGDFATAHVDVAQGGVTLSTTSAAIALGLHAEFSQLALYAGPGARLGVAYMQGEPGEPSRTLGKSFFAPFGGPLVWGRIAYLPGRRLRLGLDLEVGVATLPAHAVASNTRVLSLDGVWSTAVASIGLAF